MKEVILTNKEKVNLENELQNYKSHRNKQLKEFLIIFIIGTIIGGILVYQNNGNLKFLIGILGIMIVMIVPVIIAFLISKKGVNKLTSDLKKGKKIEGKATIRSINFFNRAIRLSNGIKIFEPNEHYKTYKKGDLINFKVSPSNEYIFECIKD